MARQESTSQGEGLPEQHNTFDPALLQIRVVPYSPPRLSSDNPSSAPLSPQNGVDHPERDVADTPGLVSRPRYQVSALAYPSVNAMSEASDSVDNLSQVATWAGTPSTGPLPSSSPSYRRSRRTITVNSDKTFSLLPQSESASSATESLRTPRRSSTAPSSPADRTTCRNFVDELPSSPLTPLQELSWQPSTYCLPPSPPLPSNFAIQTSPSWDYAFVGGVRRVPNSAKGSKSEERSNLAISTRQNLQVGLLDSDLSSSEYVRRRIPITKPSLRSSESASTLSEKSNYRTFACESPCPATAQFFETTDNFNLSHVPPSSSHSNFEVIDGSVSEQSTDDHARPETTESDKNFVLHGDIPSPSPAAVGPSVIVLKTEYSRESLLVAPLRPSKRILSDQAKLSRRKSSGSLRRGSLTAASSAFVEDAARSIFTGSIVIPSHRALFRQTSARRSVSIGPGNRHFNLPYHQWGETLSPVLSESDRGSAVPSSAFSHSTTGDQRRQTDISSLDRLCHLPDDSRADVESCVDLSHPSSYRTWNRDVNSSNLRLIRDHDEHGDGLADLDELHRRPSRTRLHRYMSSLSSDRNLCSSGSSRSNSFSGSYIPAWARLYYGGGERRFLTIQHSSDSLRSEFSAYVPNSPAMSRSSSAERWASITRFPHPLQPLASHPPPMVPNPAPDISYISRDVVRLVKKQTSSVWSPHLFRDRRSHRYSLWRPPSRIWVAREDKSQGKNIQAALFFLGFVFPFAWIFASFLPLPPTGQAHKNGECHSTGHLDLERGSHSTKWQTDSKCHSRAKWWRDINRLMAIIGLCFIAATVALIVTGTRQWKP